MSLPRKIMEQCGLCPRKIMEQGRLCPAKSWSLCCLSREITETLFFAPQNYGAMQTLPPIIKETYFWGPKQSLNEIFFSFL